MKSFKTLVLTLLFAFMMCNTSWAAFSVSGVSAKQRYPWNGKVDIDVTLSGTSNEVVSAQYSFVATNSATSAVLPVSHVTATLGAVGSGTIWKRRFVWDAGADIGAAEIEEVTLTVGTRAVSGVQLWENGPYWAACNVGATKPEEYGYYFWWGDTIGYKRNADDDGWVSVKNGTAFSFSSSNCPTYGKNNSQLQSAGYIDATGNLIAAHDAANAHLGADWRMPTDAEIQALISNCTTTWMTSNGVSGRLVTGKGAYASKSIFLPAAGDGINSALDRAGSDGYYWSSTPNSDYSLNAWFLYFYSGNFYRYFNLRYNGQSVRPVREFASGSTAILSASTTLSLDCRTGARESSGDEVLRYSNLWDGDANATVTITQNGVTLVSGLKGEGDYAWNVLTNGTYVLTHTTYTNGVAGEIETATFVVTGQEPAYTITKIAAAQRYPWNGLVDIEVTINGESNEVAKLSYSFSATNNATGAVLPVINVVPNGAIYGSGATWKRRYIWNAAADIGAAEIEEVTLTVGTRAVSGVQLWENGPYWAECNVGATRPEEYGYYFWWGDTTAYKRNAANNCWVSVKDGTPFSFSSSNCPTYGKSNSQLQSVGYIDSTGNLVATRDAATVYLGSSWRMPTDAEIQVFISNCTTAWVTSNSVYGRLVTGKGAFASKSIFLPATGDGNDSRLNYAGSVGSCWSSTPDSNRSNYAWNLNFGSSYFRRDDYYRYYGRPVRPVQEFSSGSNVSSSASTTLSLDCRTGVREPTGEELLRYSNRWDGDADATVTIEQNGVPLVSGLTGEGERTWSVLTNGTYVLTHTTYTNGVAGKIETTTFVVTGKEPAYTITKIAAAQRYPWNGLVDIEVTINGESNEVAKLSYAFSATNNATGAVLPVINVVPNGGIYGTGTTWKHRYIWNAAADIGAVKIDEIALAVEASVGVQLWENGPYWAECNVGATKSEDYGYYFWWGDTVGYKRNVSNNGWVSMKDGIPFSFSSSNCPTYVKDNSQLQSAGYIDSTGNLVPAHDAAMAYLGADWRMPTDAEVQALISNCTTDWVTSNNVSGRLVTGKGAFASKSIFLPAAGYGLNSGISSAGSIGDYWSSTPKSGCVYRAWRLGFTSSSFGRYYDGGRYFGQSIRPVREFASGSSAISSASTTLSLDCRLETHVPEGSFVSIDLLSDMHIAALQGVNHAAGDKVTVKIEGLPKGLKLVATQQKETTGKKAVTNVVYTIEGVPTEAADFDTQPMYARIMVTKGKTKTETLEPIRLAIDLPEVREFPDGVLNTAYVTSVTNIWPEADATWSFKGWPAGLKYTAKDILAKDKSIQTPAYTLYGTPTKPGSYTITASHPKTVGKTKYTETATAILNVWPNADEPGCRYTNTAYVAIVEDVDAHVKTGAVSVKTNHRWESISTLPTGLKYTNKNIEDPVLGPVRAYSIYGTPTKPGVYTVTMTLTDGSKDVFLWKITEGVNDGFLGTMDWMVDKSAVTIKQGVIQNGWTCSLNPAAKVTASNLPAGLKLAQDKTTKAWSLSGTPTKAGNYVVTFKTTLNGVTKTERIAIIVEEADWTGSWYGVQQKDTDASWLAEATVSADGTVKLVFTEGAVAKTVKTTVSVKNLDANGHTATFLLPRDKSDPFAEDRICVLDFAAETLVVDDDIVMGLHEKVSDWQDPAEVVEFVVEEDLGTMTNVYAYLTATYAAKTASYAITGKLSDGSTVKGTVYTLCHGALSPILVANKMKDAVLIALGKDDEGYSVAIRENGESVNIGHVWTAAFAATALKSKKFNQLSADDRIVIQAFDSVDAGGSTAFDLSDKDRAAAVSAQGLVKFTIIDGEGWNWTCELLPIDNEGEIRFRGIATGTKKGEASKYGYVWSCSPDGGQLWEGGPYWAKCNVGATKPEGFGYYFWWGDTVGYTNVTERGGWVSVKDGTKFSFTEPNCPTYNKSNVELETLGYIDSKCNLLPAYDAATVHLGAPWRLPTYAEISNLVTCCDATWTTRNGVYGRLVTGRGAYASKSIFLPATGRAYMNGLDGTGSFGSGSYWASAPDVSASTWAYFLSCAQGSCAYNSCSRFIGISVRPVR